MSVPSGYVDPSSIASRYPRSGKPALSSTFVAPPTLREQNSNLPVEAGAGLILVGVIGAGFYWWIHKVR